MLQKCFMMGATALALATTSLIIPVPTEAGSSTYRPKAGTGMLMQRHIPTNPGQFRDLAAPIQHNKKEPGYPTVGKAVQACGAGNVFVVYVEGPTSNSEHRYDCAE